MLLLLLLLLRLLLLLLLLARCMPPRPPPPAQLWLLQCSLWDWCVRRVPQVHVCQGLRQALSPRPRGGDQVRGAARGQDAQRLSAAPLHPRQPTPETPTPPAAALYAGAARRTAGSRGRAQPTRAALRQPLATPGRVVTPFSTAARPPCLPAPTQASWRPPAAPLLRGPPAPQLPAAARALLGLCCTKPAPAPRSASAASCSTAARGIAAPPAAASSAPRGTCACRCPRPPAAHRRSAHASGAPTRGAREQQHRRTAVPGTRCA